MADNGFDDFELLFRRLYPLAGWLAYRIVGNRESAEDTSRPKRVPGRSPVGVMLVGSLIVRRGSRAWHRTSPWMR